MRQQHIDAPGRESRPNLPTPAHMANCAFCLKPMIIGAVLFFMTLCMPYASGEDVSSKLKASNLYPIEAKSRLEISQHQLHFLPGGFRASSRSPNGAYMWSKELDEKNRVVVVYIEKSEGGLLKVDEFTYGEDDLPRSSKPQKVEVEGEKIIYYSGGNPKEPRRVLFERTSINKISK